MGAHKLPRCQALHTPSALTSHRNARLRAHAASHTCHPRGSPAEGRAPALPLSTAILRSPWAFLTWGLTTPLPVTSPGPALIGPGHPMGKVLSRVLLAYTPVPPATATTTATQRDPAQSKYQEGKGKSR